MTKFLLRRSLLAIGILFCASILVFAATQLFPGNAALAILGKSATAQRVRELDVQMHLNASAVTQYWRWLTQLMRGNLGTSVASNTSVSTVIGGRLVNTGFLVASSALIGVPLGLALGVVSAAFRDRWLDNALSTLTLSLAAIPEFVLGLVLIICFGTLLWPILPASVDLAPGAVPWDNLTAMVLPTLTLALAIAPYVARITRAAMVDALASEYVEFAELSGVSRKRVILKHALPNAFAPAAQAIAVSLAYLAGGAIVVEYIFAYPGIGQGLVLAVQARDVPTIQAITILLAALYVFLNLMADIVTILLSPRVRTAKI